MEVVRREDVEGDTEYEPGMEHFFGIGNHCGANDITMTYGTLEQGDETRAHYHVKSDLALYILSGTMRMTAWDRDFNTTTAEFSADSFCYVPEGEIHQAEPVGEEDVEVIACYNNAGSGYDTQKHFVDV
jgi:oxalate decarboxylase/phosphoglucose isomerase-like protein (cupin superfamily)